LSPKAVLFDLDNTLLLEDEVTDRAYRTAAAFASTQHAVDAAALAEAAEAEADRLWRASPTFAHADAIGISAGEAMWGDFADAGRGLEALHEFSLLFRQEVWSAALARCGVLSRRAAPLVAQAFVDARRAGQLADPDAANILATLAARYRLGIVTNGASRVQREKLVGSGFADRIGAVAVSGEIGHGKPEPHIVNAALDALGVRSTDAVMVGDSIERDVAAARAAGVYAVWLDRGGIDADKPAPDARITSLRELPALLDALP
jgi:putative hydrolase of the HAD superfamily